MPLASVLRVDGAYTMPGVEQILEEIRLAMGHDGRAGTLKKRRRRWTRQIPAGLSESGTDKRPAMRVRLFLLVI